MKASILASALAVIALSSSAFAAAPLVRSDSGGDAYMSGVTFPGTFNKTRAEVKAETIAALRKRPVNYDESYPSIEPPVSSKTRAEVRAELAQAVKSGQLRSEQ